MKHTFLKLILAVVAGILVMIAVLFIFVMIEPALTYEFDISQTATNIVAVFGILISITLATFVSLTIERID